MRRPYRNNIRRPYVPIVPTHTKNKRPKANKFKATSDVDPDSLKKGMTFEFVTVLLRGLLYLIALIGGMYLTFQDIQDKGLLFEGFGFKYSGSCVGIVILLAAIGAMIFNKQDVRIDNK